MTQHASDSFPIVCLGGSAGALNAYLEILRRLPINTGMAFVIVAHRGANDTHLLPELLAGATKMPVIEVHQSMPLEPNKIFVAPHDKDLTVNGSILELQPRLKRSGWPKSITEFLNSLAAAVGPRAIAVILSGMDADGATALAAIKARTFAQSNASRPSMPISAVQTGNVDFVMTASNIATELRRISREEGGHTDTALAKRPDWLNTI